jgi:aryl-phospho-beta-D-glucosidase BglC (GH1 family)
MVDGLWAGGSSFATDYNTILYKMKMLGFNSIRLPFTFRDLELKPISKAISCSVSTKQEFIHKLTPPHYKSNKQIPYFPSNNKLNGICNDYIPMDSTLKRLQWVVSTFTRNNMYVILDYHPMGTEPVSKESLPTKWLSLWESFLEMPNFNEDIKGRVILDLI